MCIETSQALSWWTFDPLVIGTLSASSIVYARGLSGLWRTAGVGAGIRPCGGGGLLPRAAQLGGRASVTDRSLSDLLFSAHMTQHELLFDRRATSDRAR